MTEEKSHPTVRLMSIVYGSEKYVNEKWEKENRAWGRRRGGSGRASPYLPRWEGIPHDLPLLDMPGAGRERRAEMGNREEEEAVAGFLRDCPTGKEERMGRSLCGACQAEGGC